MNTENEEVLNKLLEDFVKKSTLVIINSRMTHLQNDKKEINLTSTNHKV